MKGLKTAVLAFSLFVGLSSKPAEALPGQLIETVEAWIQAHPTLQPRSGERLVIRKAATPAQRFTFEASVFPPGRVTPSGREMIRSESIDLFDMVNGVTPARLEESLRVIYGIDVFQDYAQAQVIYKYPDPPQLRQARNQQTPLYQARQGELRLGDRFGYWLEVVDTPNGKAYNGSLVLFERQYLDKLESELRNF